MADNYLEKQMEDFRAGKIATRRSSEAMHRPQPVAADAVAMPGKRVLVACHNPADTASLVRLLRSTGARVAFIAPAGKEWQQLAQASGSRFYPATMPQSGEPLDQTQTDSILTDLKRHWHGIDIVAGDLHPFVNMQF